MADSEEEEEGTLEVILDGRTVTAPMAFLEQMQRLAGSPSSDGDADARASASAQLALARVPPLRLAVAARPHVERPRVVGESSRASSARTATDSLRTRASSAASSADREGRRSLDQIRAALSGSPRPIGSTSAAEAISLARDQQGDFRAVHALSLDDLAAPSASAIADAIDASDPRAGGAARNAWAEAAAALGLAALFAKSAALATAVAGGAGALGGESEATGGAHGAADDGEAVRALCTSASRAARLARARQPQHRQLPLGQGLRMLLKEKLLLFGYLLPSMNPR
jgi:hypothetical protein